MSKITKQKLYEFDEIVVTKFNGVYTDPSAEPDLKNLKIRDLIKYCKKESKDISKISREEILRFV